jgi:nicotinate phosphoribosyltransferase
MREEDRSPDGEPLLQPVMKGGSRLAAPASLSAAQRRGGAALDWLPAGARDLRRPHPVPLRLSDRLAVLDAQVRHHLGH